MEEWTWHEPGMDNDVHAGAQMLLRPGTELPSRLAVFD